MSRALLPFTLLLFLAGVSACSSKPDHTPFKNLASFNQKAPAELLADPVIGPEFTKLVHPEQQACLDNIFNYMSDLEVYPDNSIGAEMTGAHSSLFFYAYLNLTPQGELDLVITCDKSGKSNHPYIYYTNRDLENPPTSRLKKWVEAYGQQDIGSLTITNGKQKLQIALSTFLDRSSSESAITLAKQDSYVGNLADLSCTSKNPNGKPVGYVKANFPSDLTQLETNSACAAVTVSIEEFRKTAEEVVKKTCELADAYTKKVGGYAAAIANASESGDARTQKLIASCEPIARKNLLQKILSKSEIGIYSAGKFKNGTKDCSGLLMMLSTGNSYGFYLRGIGDCNNFQTLSDSNKPNHGDVLAEQFKYSGELPEWFRVSGEDRVFSSRLLNKPTAEELEEEDANPPPDYAQLENAESSHASSSAPGNLTVGQRYVLGLADALKEGHPACQVIAANMRNIAYSGNPDYIIERQGDAMLNNVPSICIQ